MKKILASFFAAAALLVSAASARAEFSVPAIFSDGMVLQQNSHVAIWGTAEPGEEVIVFPTWGLKSAKCTTAEDGTWKVFLDTPSASYTHYFIKISAGPKGKQEKVLIKNVLVGEVWFASGQSNMEMPIRGFFNCPVAGAQEYITSAPMDNRVRMFTAKKGQSYEPCTDVEGKWLGATPSTIGDMSATAFFFARKLTEVLNIPVGIVCCAYGGAKVESWMPKDLLEAYGTYDLSREKIEATKSYTRPYLMYNAMLNPLKGYGIKGFIWYQGCSNVGSYDVYAERMGKMVERWRADWAEAGAQNAQNLPFYQVEIAPCTCYADNPDGTSPAAELRQAQHNAAAAIPGSAIVVTNDLVEEYEAWNIHPAKKRQVGDRLAFLALNRDYGYSGLHCEVPTASKAVRQLDGSIKIAISGLEWNGVDRTRGIKALEVKAADGTWREVTEANFVWDEWVLKIEKKYAEGATEVRYGWGAFKPGNLHSLYGLPVAPFCLKVE